jgi:TPR repeat protein
MKSQQLSGKKSRNAIFEIALVYRNEGNIKAALEEYKKAITYKQQSPDAMFHLAAHYLLGQDVEIDNKYALSLLEDAAKLGHARAQLFVGNCYERGLGVLRNKKKALECYKNSALLGDSDGDYLTGRCYEKGLGTNVDIMLAFKHYEAAAMQGNKNGLYQLGRCYEYGIGIQANKDQAIYYYTQAAGGANLTLKGHTSAQAKVAEYYLLNTNIYSFKDNSKKINYGKKCLILALTKRHSLAQYVMAQCHEYGLYDFEKNLKKAISLYKRAERMSESAKQALKERGDSFVEEDTLNFTSQLINQGKELLLLGEHIKKDDKLENDKKAASLFYRAAMLDNVIAQEYLVGCYLKGIGVKKNLAQALWWLEIVSYQKVQVAYNIELFNIINYIKSDISPLDEDFLIVSASQHDTADIKAVNKDILHVLNPQVRTAVTDTKSIDLKVATLPENYLKQLHEYIPFFEVAMSNKDQLMSVITEQKNHEIAKQEREYIFKSETLYDYYNLMIMQLEGIMLAAKVIHSKMVDNAQKNAVDYVSMGIKEVGSHIPILSIGTSILSAIINAMTERNKVTFVNAVASYFNSISFSSKVAEELARQLTLLQESDLVKLAVIKPGFFKRLYLSGKKLINKIAADDIDNGIKELAAKQAEVIITAVAQSKLGKVFSQNEIDKIIMLFNLKKPSVGSAVLPMSPSGPVKSAVMLINTQSVTSPVAASLATNLDKKHGASPVNFSSHLKSVLEKRGIVEPIKDSKVYAPSKVVELAVIKSSAENKKHHLNEKELRDKRIYHENHLKYECLGMQAKIQAKRLECTDYLSKCVEKQKLVKSDAKNNVEYFNTVFLLKMQEYLIVCYLGRTGEKINVSLSNESPGDTEIRIIDRFLHDLMRAMGHTKLISLIENISQIISGCISHIYDSKDLESPNAILHMKKLFSQGIIKAVQSGYFNRNLKSNGLVKGKGFVCSIVENMISCSEESDFKKTDLMNKMDAYLNKVSINLSESFESQSSKVSANGMFGEVNKEGKVPLMLSPRLVEVLEREALRLSGLSVNA